MRAFSAAAARSSGRVPSTRRGRYRRGFTLIETIVALGLIAALTAMALSSYWSTKSGANDAMIRMELVRLQSALNDAYVTNNRFPPIQSRTTAPAGINYRPPAGVSVAWGVFDPANYQTIQPVVYDDATGRYCYSHLGYGGTVPNAYCP